MGSKDNSFLGTLKRKYGEENELVLFMATQLVRTCAMICNYHVWANSHFVTAVYRSHTFAREAHVRVSVASHAFYLVCVTGFALERGQLLHRCVRQVFACSASALLLRRAHYVVTHSIQRSSPKGGKENQVACAIMLPRCEGELPQANLDEVIWCYGSVL